MIIDVTFHVVQLTVLLPGFSFYHCHLRIIPVEGSRDIAWSLNKLHFLGSMKEIGFRWTLLCNSHALYVVIPMKIWAKKQCISDNRMWFKLFGKKVNKSWLAPIKDLQVVVHTVSSYKQMWFSNLKFGFIVMKQMFSFYSYQ